MITQILRSLVSLTIFVLMAWAVILIGMAVLPVLVLIACIAVIWYSVKFYQIRKELEKNLGQHGRGNFQSGTNPSEGAEGEIIEAEYEVVEVEKSHKD